MTHGQFRCGRGSRARTRSTPRAARASTSISPRAQLANPRRRAGGRTPYPMWPRSSSNVWRRAIAPSTCPVLNDRPRRAVPLPGHGVPTGVTEAAPVTHPRRASVVNPDRACRRGSSRPRAQRTQSSRHCRKAAWSRAEGGTSSSMGESWQIAQTRRGPSPMPASAIRRPRGASGSRLSA